MRGYKFNANYGGEIKTVEIRLHPGGGEGYHLYINRYYQGVMLYRNGEWNGYFNGEADLTADEITILADIIKQHLQ